MEPTNWNWGAYGGNPRIEIPNYAPDISTETVGARFWAGVKELLQNRPANMSPKPWSLKACLQVLDELRELLSTLMDSKFNAEETDISADLFY